MTKRCENCKYFVGDEEYRGGFKCVDNGECRRFPETVYVSAYNWCGEFKK